MQTTLDFFSERSSTLAHELIILGSEPRDFGYTFREKGFSTLFQE